MSAVLNWIDMVSYFISISFISMWYFISTNAGLRDGSGKSTGFVVAIGRVLEIDVCSDLIGSKPP